MKKYFLTFGGPSENYRRRVSEVVNKVISLKLFDYVFGFTDQNLLNENTFLDTHKDFLINNTTGYGYWIWKSYLVNKVLDSMNDGDILLYCDVGCEININGIERLNEYFDIVKNSSSGILTFYLYPLLEYEWTKNDVFEYLKCSDDIKNTYHHVGGIFFIKKCENSINFAKKFYETCCNYNLLNDSPSITPNHPDFKHHRHDQSILSCLSKIYNSEKIQDETYFYPNWEKDGFNYPIWAKRNRG